MAYRPPSISLSDERGQEKLLYAAKPPSARSEVHSQSNNSGLSMSSADSGYHSAHSLAYAPFPYHMPPGIGQSPADIFVSPMQMWRCDGTCDSPAEFSTYQELAKHNSTIPHGVLYPPRVADYHGRYQSAPVASFGSRKRDMRTAEEDPGWTFLEHSKRCNVCHDPYRVYRNHGRLCDLGNRLAQDVAQVLELSSVGEVRSKIDDAQVDLGLQYEGLRPLLKAILKSDRRRGTPFLSFGNERSPMQRRMSIVQPSPPPRQLRDSTPSTPHLPIVNQTEYSHRYPNYGREASYHGDRRDAVVIVDPSGRNRRSPWSYYRTEGAPKARGNRAFTETKVSQRRIEPPSSPDSDSEKVVRFELPQPLEFDKLPAVQRRSVSPPSPRDNETQIRLIAQTPSKVPDRYPDRYTTYREPLRDPWEKLKKAEIPSAKARRPRVIYETIEEHSDCVESSDSSGESDRELDDDPNPLANVSKKVTHESGGGGGGLRVEKHLPEGSSLDKALVLAAKSQSPSGRDDVEANQGIDSIACSDEGENDAPNSIDGLDRETPNDECSSSEAVEGVLSSALVQVKDLLLRGLLDYAVSEEATDGLDGFNKRTRDTTSASSSQTSDRPPQKRRRGGGRDPGDGGDGSGDDGDSDRPKKGGKPFPFGHQRRLKCPFYQRDPEKHSRAACRGEGFADMAKLKDHIKRAHTQPLRCGRCWLDMENQKAYANHQQADISCKKQPQPNDDRITYQFLKELDFKKAPYAQAKSPEGKWKILYSTLFPTDSNIPSPYEQHGFTPRLEKVLCEALEEELTRELAPALEPILRRIKERIPAIIQNCKLKLLRASPDSIDTPSSGTFIGSTESELGDCPLQTDFHHRPVEGPSSGSSREALRATNAATNSMSSKAVGKRPQRDHTSPSAGSSSDDFQNSRHASSPESVFDNRVTPPTPNLYDHTFGTVPAQFPATTPSLGHFEAPFSVPGSFPGSGDPPLFGFTTEAGNLIADPDFDLPQQQSLQVPFIPSNHDYSTQVPANNTLPPHSQPGTAMSNEKDAQHESGNVPMISDLDYLPDDFDIDQFFQNT
ncbi:hypothetical protein CC80DRAFT_588198 [Byssothecium circinans]|uniref:C2H2-type domain-containing protein n=1 Tax=Byssothecium circinans TaxID=147558 RepID=A0A6A5UEC8_9PLEO|nr:hypothetical protein CC80DRAFT_588198 [Byssothecium circinans]